MMHEDLRPTKGVLIGLAASIPSWIAIVVGFWLVFR